MGITSCQKKYSGDGKFIDNGFFSTSNRYDIYFDKCYIHQGESSCSISFSGIPNEYFRLNFYIYPQDLSLLKLPQNSNARNEIIHEIIGSSEINFRVEVLEDGNSNFILSRGFLHKINDSDTEWTYNPYSYDTIVYSHRSLSLKYDNKSNYEIKILMRSKMDLSDKVYVRPVMSAGEPWSL